jgi:diguanylate cyclase (GGDEF)-like protein
LVGRHMGSPQLVQRIVELKSGGEREAAVRSPSAVTAEEVGARARFRNPLAMLTGAGRVWVLTAAIAAATIALYVGVVIHTAPLATPIRLSWWMLAGLFYLTEIYVVHLEFRRDAHSFSLSEIPLVLGLFFATPSHFVIAQLLGAVVALGIARRQSVLKLAFNTGHFCLEACVATIVFHQLVALGKPLGAAGIIATFTPLILTSLIAVGAIFLAISLSEGRLQLEKFGSVLASGLIVTTTNTSIGLLGVWIIWTNPAGAWVLLIPTATVFIAYRAYTSERQKRQSLDFLNESTRILQESHEIETGILSLLRNAREMFRGEIAEMVIFPGGDDLPLATTIGPGRHDVVMLRPLPELIGGFGDRIGGRDEGAFLNDASQDEALTAFLKRRSFKDAMLAPLRGETRTFGLFVVANRLGDVSHFDDEDLKLFETLAHHASVALEKGRLEKSLAQLSALEEELQHQASHDPLTGLANRVLFTDRVEHALSRRDRSGPVAVIFIDLDDFKTVNDSVGHSAGDQLLVTVGDRISHCLRSEDTAARLGGDEFGILIDEAKDPSDAAYVAERITRALEAPFILQSREVFVHASLGIAFGEPEIDTDTLLRNADVAMYRAKGQGKGRYVLYQSSMHTAVVKRMELKAELERAVEQEQFVVHYQPIFSLKTGRITAAEALVRWRHPEHGLLPPAEFVPLAEETGLIVPLSRWVLAAACRQARSWHAQDRGEHRALIAVNLSPRHIQQPTLVDDVVEALRTSLIQPQNLILELTENVLMHDSEATISKLTELRSLGVQIALDDFGNGFSSLGYLRRFPLDIVKIAKCFIDDLNHGVAGTELVDAMIKLGAALGVKIIAEGIETGRQYTRVARLGCDGGQGNYLSPAVEAPEFEQLLGIGTLSLLSKEAEPGARSVILPA